MRIMSGLIIVGAMAGTGAWAQDTPSPALLVLHKGENAMAIVDPESGKIAGHVPTGQDPHELAVSSDGKLAFASNYSGSSEHGGNSISVIDIAARKELHHVDLTPLGRPHGLWFADGKLYFTAEANMAIGRYDPSTNKVDWLLGTGQERTHMVLVGKELKTIFTSNVESNTISIIERDSSPRTFRRARRTTSRWTWRAAARWAGSGRTTSRWTWRAAARWAGSRWAAARWAGSRWTAAGWARWTRWTAERARWTRWTTMETDSHLCRQGPGRV